MRVAALVAGMLGATACYDDPYGAIIEASGTIEFDHVEVFFGHEAGNRTPLTPRRLQSMVRPPVDESQLLLERRFVDDDGLMATPNPRETAWKYFIPYNEQNKDLHRYALIVVSKNGEEVGAAELFDFEVPSDAVHRYMIPIEPLANEDYERWGAESDCLRWTRQRANKLTTIAVVPSAGNPDCDVFGTEDCDDMRHCDPTRGDLETSGCYAPDACLIRNAAGCSAGDCINKTVGVEPPCEAATCIDARLCTACNSEDPREIAECAATAGTGANTHPDLGLPLMGGVDARTLCSKPTYDMDVTLPLPCIEPEIEAVSYYYADDESPGPLFQFQLFGSTSTTCRLHITEPFPDAPWVGTPHFVASVRSTSNGSFRRTRFVFGVHDDGTACGEQPALPPEPILEGCGY